MRIVMLGLRGLPGVQGGIETHVQHLARELVHQGCEIEVVVRAPYMGHYTDSHWQNARLTRVWSPRSQSLETIVHTFLSVIVAARRRPDVLHIHGIGPSIVAPIARLLGIKVIMTHHGRDYQRQKWSRAAKAVLRVCETIGVKSSNKVIAISREIASHTRSSFGKECVVIPNGVEVRSKVQPGLTLKQFELHAGKYVLFVGRSVPEKRHLDLLRAFEVLSLPGWKLAFVGRADHEDNYSRALLAEFAKAKNVIATGFQSGEQLAELYSSAGVFVLPSTHEGMPIALLEAMSYQIPIVASDIPANREIGLKPDSYFMPTDVRDLARVLQNAIAKVESSLANFASVDMSEYEWSGIAARTLNVYRDTLELPTSDVREASVKIATT